MFLVKYRAVWNSYLFKNPPLHHSLYTIVYDIKCFCGVLVEQRSSDLMLVNKASELDKEKIQFCENNITKLQSTCVLLSRYPPSLATSNLLSFGETFFDNPLKVVKVLPRAILKLSCGLLGVYPYTYVPCNFLV